MQLAQRSTPTTLLVVSVVLVVLMVGVSVYAWIQTPAGGPVCIHWNAAGECDGYGGRFVGIFMMPIVAAAVTLLFAFIPRLEPRASNLAKSATAYAIVWAATLVFLAALHVILTLDILGYSADIALLMPLLTGALFVAIGGSLRHVRSNYFFGIRTPWTLSSEAAWEKTHRLGSWLFLALAGMILVAPLILASAIWVYAMLGGILITIIVLAVYSYAVWKGDTASHTEP